MSIVDQAYQTIGVYDESTASRQQPEGSVAVQNYLVLKLAINKLGAAHEERGSLDFSGYDGENIRDDLASACNDVRSETALAAYAVDYISYDLDRLVSYYEAEVFIYYLHTAEELDAIVSTGTVSGLNDAISAALDEMSTGLVVMVNAPGASEAEVADYVTEAYFADPLSCVNRPVADVTMYTGGGLQRIYEISLDYGASSPTLSSRKDILEGDLRYIAEHGYTAVSVGEILDYCAGRGELPEKPILITFDDGQLSVLTYALPLLERYDMCAVAAVVGALNQIQLHILPALFHTAIKNHAAFTVDNAVFCTMEYDRWRDHTVWLYAAFHRKPAAQLLTFTQVRMPHHHTFRTVWLAVEKLGRIGIFLHDAAASVEIYDALNLRRNAREERIFHIIVNHAGKHGSVPAVRVACNNDFFRGDPVFFRMHTQKAYGISGIHNLCRKRCDTRMAIFHHSHCITTFCKLCQSRKLCIDVLLKPCGALYKYYTRTNHVRLVTSQWAQNL